MRIFNNLFLFLFFAVAVFANEAVEDEIHGIDWHLVYGNVYDYMSVEGKSRYFDRHIAEVEYYVSEYGYLALYAIAKIETSLKGDINTKVGDYTLYQINGYWWNVKKLSVLSGVDNLTKSVVRENAAYFAAHIFVYNMFEALIRRKSVKDLCEAITVYHQPYRVSKDYYRKAERYFKGCGDIRYAAFRVD
jgi:hypothetical protein